jgi:uncharacterized membrane protein YfcA
VDPLELIAFVVWCFLVALAGGLVGLVLGNIRLPAMLLLASSPAAAGAANIAVSGVAAAAASVSHIRADRVNWRLFGWMAPPSVLGALAGGWLAGSVGDTALLLAIAAVLLYSGFDLLRWTPRSASPDDDRGSEAASPALDVRAAVLSGLTIGVLGGLVGLILGSLRMPALLKLVGERPARAAGTNLAVGVCVGVAGLVGHLPNSAPDWDLLALGAAASVPGALLGARLTGRLSELQLVRAIALALLVAGSAAAVQALA